MRLFANHTTYTLKRTLYHTQGTTCTKIMWIFGFPLKIFNKNIKHKCLCVINTSYKKGVDYELIYPKNSRKHKKKEKIVFFFLGSCTWITSGITFSLAC